MDDSGRPPWIGSAILVAMIYLAVSTGSAALAGTATSDRMRFFWRLSAFVVSGIVFAAHIAHEHFRLRHPARPAACHASVAAALGGFALAVAANVHDLGSASGYRPRMLIALLAWPLLTGVPAFVLALVIAAGLGMRRTRV